MYGFQRRYKQKLKTEKCKNIDEVKEDFLLLVAISKLYYKNRSSEFYGACLLESLILRTIDSVMSGEVIEI